MNFLAMISLRTIESQLATRCVEPAFMPDSFERREECRTWMDHLWEDRIDLVKPNAIAISRGTALRHDWGEHVEAYIETHEYEEA